MCTFVYFEYAIKFLFPICELQRPPIPPSLSIQPFPCPLSCCLGILFFFFFFFQQELEKKKKKEKEKNCCFIYLLCFYVFLVEKKKGCKKKKKKKKKKTYQDSEIYLKDFCCPSLPVSKGDQYKTFFSNDNFVKLQPWSIYFFRFYVRSHGLLGVDLIFFFKFCFSMC